LGSSAAKPDDMLSFLDIVNNYKKSNGEEQITIKDLTA
jgi:hypothetical protein